MVYLLKEDCSRVSSESCTVVQGLVYVLFPNIWQNAKHVDIDNRYISMDGEKIRQIMTQTNRLWLQPLLQPLCGQLHVSQENIVQVFICVLGQIKVLEAGGFGGGREGVSSDHPRVPPYPHTPPHFQDRLCCRDMLFYITLGLDDNFKQ